MPRTKADTSWQKPFKKTFKKTPSEKPRRQRLSWPLLLGSPAQDHRSHVLGDEWSECCHTRVANRWKKGCSMSKYVQISSDSQVSIGFAAWFCFRHVQILDFTIFHMISLRIHHPNIIRFLLPVAGELISVQMFVQCFAVVGILAVPLCSTLLLARWECTHDWPQNTTDLCKWVKWVKCQLLKCLGKNFCNFPT